MLVAVECPPASDSEIVGSIFLAQGSRCDVKPVVGFPTQLLSWGELAALVKPKPDGMG